MDAITTPRTGSRHRMGFPLPGLWGLLVLLLLTACADRAEPPAAVEEVVFGWISPGLTSPTTALGALQAVRDLEEQGGLDLEGRRIALRLLVEESSNSPETAASQAFALINREGVAGLLGLASTPTALPVSKVAEFHRVPMITVLASHPEVTENRRFSFRLTADDRAQGRALADAAVHHLEAHRAGLLVDVANPYCVSLAEHFSAAFEDLGGAVVHTETYTEDREDFEGHFERLGQAGIDVLLLPNVSPHNQPALRTARQQGFSQPVLGGDSWAAMAPEDQRQVDDVYFLDLWAPELEPRAQDFADQVHEQHQLPANGTMALGYDAVTLLAEAIRRQGSIEPEAIRAGLASIESFQGLGGLYAFPGSAGNPRRQLYLRHLRGGEAHLIDTLELATPATASP